MVSGKGSGSTFKGDSDSDNHRQQQQNRKKMQTQIELETEFNVDEVIGRSLMNSVLELCRNRLHGWAISQHIELLLHKISGRYKDFPGGFDDKPEISYASSFYQKAPRSRKRNINSREKPISRFDDVYNSYPFYPIRDAGILQGAASQRIRSDKLVGPAHPQRFHTGFRAAAGEREGESERKRERERKDTDKQTGGNERGDITSRSDSGDMDMGSSEVMWRYDRDGSGSGSLIKTIEELIVSYIDKEQHSELRLQMLEEVV